MIVASALMLAVMTYSILVQVLRKNLARCSCSLPSNPYRL
jgi:hypothetical protein